MNAAIGMASPSYIFHTALCHAAQPKANGRSTVHLQPASQPASHSGKWVNVDGDYYWNPGPYYSYGPDWCDWNGYWGWGPGYGCIPAWDFRTQYITGHYGHWYNHPNYGPLWGLGDRHPSWATAGGSGWQHGMNGDEWRHSGSSHGAASSPPFHHSEPTMASNSSRGHGISPHSSGTRPTAPSGGRSSGGGFSGGGHGGGGGGHGGGGHGRR